MPNLPSITRFYRSCDPDMSLEPGDQRYVDLSFARSEGANGWRKRLARALRQVDRSSVFLVSGFLGDGKSTELLRLKEDLQKSDPKLAVVYIDGSQFLNAYAYTFNEFLLGVIAETGKQLRDDYGIELRRDYLGRKLDEIKTFFFSEAELQEMGADAGTDALKVSATIALRARDSDKVRQQLADALAGDRTTLNKEFADSINRNARPKLQQMGYKDLVIIIDWLEKLVDLPPTDNLPVSGHDALFLHHAQLIREWGAQVVMTTPIDMVYSSRQANLSLAYGCDPIVINQVGVAEFLKKEQKDAGVSALLNVLRLRAEKAPDGPVNFTEVFESIDLAKEIICFSGGHLRTLMMLIRLCCGFIDELPITRDAVDGAIRDHMLSSARRVKDQWIEKLVEVNKTHNIVNDADHFEMLRTLCVLAYANGVPLYGVDPAIQRLPKFKELSK